MRTGTLKISREEARIIALNAQGLARPHAFGKGRPGVLSAIKHLGYVQIDTLSVVARAHHHTLWTRTAAYKEKYLDELIKDRKIFEYWSHAAAYLPMEDFRYSLPRKATFLKGRSHWFGKDKQVMKYVLDRIRSEGPLQSRHFEHAGKKAAWFDWKPAKNALEQLFQEGTLMITGRQGFQKVYDLAGNVLPAGIDTSMPAPDEYAIYLVRTALRAHGFASVKEIAYLRRGVAPKIEKAIRKLLKEGEIRELSIEQNPEKYYTAGNFAALLKPPAAYAVLLSPFDNAVIMRSRVKRLFGFDFCIECYLPSHKRTYGYFSLPILCNGAFIGRLDPKADREKGVFLIKNLYLEQSLPASGKIPAILANAIEAFAGFNGCKEIMLGNTHPASVKRGLQAELV